MKKLIEGAELYYDVPNDCRPTGIGPVVRLQHGLILDDGNFFESPTLIEGCVGSGKTALMREIMDQVLAYADQAGDNVVIFCAKPDMLAYARDDDVLLDITSGAAESCWNLFAELKASDMPYLTLREIASALFMEAKEKTMQPFFPEAAKDMFYQTCRYMYDFSKRTGTQVSNADLVEFIETTPVWGDDAVPGWMDLAEKHPEYFSMVRDYIGDATAQGLGVLRELRILISSTLYGSFASNNGTFSAMHTLKSGGKRVFLHFDYANASHSTLSVLHVLLDLLLKQAMDAKSHHKTWFFLDEGSILPKSDVLTDALSLARDPGSNGRGGVRVIMALQSARLMTRHYTQQEAEALLSLFPNVIALKVADPMSRAVISERYGKAHYQYSYAGVGDKIHYTDSFEDVVSDYHFSQITKKGEAIMSLPGVCDFPFIYDGFRRRC